MRVSYLQFFFVLFLVCTSVYATTTLHEPFSLVSLNEKISITIDNEQQVDTIANNDSYVFFDDSGISQSGSARIDIVPINFANYSFFMYMNSALTNVTLITTGIDKRYVVVDGVAHERYVVGDKNYYDIALRNVYVSVFFTDTVPSQTDEISVVSGFLSYRPINDTVSEIVQAVKEKESIASLFNTQIFTLFSNSVTLGKLLIVFFLSVFIAFGSIYWRKRKVKKRADETQLPVASEEQQM